MGPFWQVEQLGIELQATQVFAKWKIKILPPFVFKA